MRFDPIQAGLTQHMTSQRLVNNSLTSASADDHLLYPAEISFSFSPIAADSRCLIKVRYVESACSSAWCVGVRALGVDRVSDVPAVLSGNATHLTLCVSTMISSLRSPVAMLKNPSRVLLNQPLFGSR
jgi:hypothetical protein